MPQGCGTKASPAVSKTNAAKLLALQAAVATCQNAMLTHGGYGYAKEYRVERFMREVMVLCPDHLAAHPVQHRREETRPAEVVLRAPPAGAASGISGACFNFVLQN
ncbi:acyl-CoA dehydrogenase family protein [Paracoccus sp. pheM1]|uniref:acyl-CoA dehydrogenase family protein n=1 Tax=Paracoccus sp. pheM1 TaxID=2831675 RepID=UPI001F0A734A|nr:acyl-CoA dehydrogenase family protein [Paracoccus sp. pheM1]